MDKHVLTMAEQFDISAAPMAPQMFGNAGLEHMQKYGMYWYFNFKLQVWKNSFEAKCKIDFCCSSYFIKTEPFILFLISL